MKYGNKGNVIIMVSCGLEDYFNKDLLWLLLLFFVFLRLEKLELIEFFG